MKKIPQVFGIHARPSKLASRLLAIVPFLAVIALYSFCSYRATEKNPDQKILPSLTKMVDAVDRMAFTPSKRTDEYVMLKDTTSSLKRLLAGVAISAFLGLIIGVTTGVFRGVGALTYPFLIFFSIIPPLSILPIILITFGVDELGKIMLIIIGVTPAIARGMYKSVRELPEEQLVKVLTLGANSFQYVNWIVLPQIMPRLLNTLRISFGAAWLFLIAAEFLAAQSGLGYQINIQRRYLNMDVIIPYVIWITILGFSIDTIVRYLNKFAYRWFDETKGD